MGLYFKFSIVLLYCPIIVIYFIYKRFKNTYKLKKKFKLISFKRYSRYVKLVLNSKVVLLIIISSIVSNIIVLIENKKFDNLYINEQNLTIKAVVVSNKQEKEYKYVYRVKVEYCNESNKYKNTYLYIKINKNMKANINYGDEIIVKGKFVAPTEQRNLGGFDYKKHLKTLKIYGSVNVESLKVINTNKVNIINLISNKISCKVKEKIDDNIESKKASILKGLLLGDTSYIEDNIYENFRISNMSHILAVSGMHISYIIIGINLLLKRNLGKSKTKYVVIVILILYAFITGFSASIVRAVVMAVILILSSIFHRKNDIYTSISISLFIILIYNPFLISDIGLQLSYIGTIGIILLYKDILKILDDFKELINKKKKSRYKINRKELLFFKKLREMLAVILSAQISILPITLYRFNIFGSYFLISNLLVSIIIGPIIVLGFITAVVLFFSEPISKIFIIILKFLISILIYISDLSKLPFSKIYIPTPKLLLIILYYIFIVIFKFIYQVYNSKKPNMTNVRVKNLIALAKYNFRKNKQRNIKCCVMLIIILLSVYFIFPRQLKISFIDVGQGDSILIVTPNNKTILIDGGGSASEEFDVGKSTLLPYILDRGYKKIDYIIVSHFDEDHCGGLFTIMQELRVENVIIGKQFESSENYEEFIKLVKEKNIKINLVESGQRINIEKDLYFNILWPDSRNVISDNVLNNNSLVCKLVYKDFSMLFTGDIEEIAEKEIINKYYYKSNILNSTILKVAHHGSKTSSTEEFLKSVKPKIALIGVGENNKFGHPSDVTLKSLGDIKCKIYRTDECGEITINTDGNGVNIEKFIKQ